MYHYGDVLQPWLTTTGHIASRPMATSFNLVLNSDGEQPPDQRRERRESLQARENGGMGMTQRGAKRIKREKGDEQARCRDREPSTAVLSETTGEKAATASTPRRSERRGGYAPLPFGARRLFFPEPGTEPHLSARRLTIEAVHTSPPIYRCENFLSPSEVPIICKHPLGSVAE